MINGLPCRVSGRAVSDGAARDTLLSSLTVANHHLLNRSTKSLYQREMERVA
jgi:hypothetical protein